MTFRIGLISLWPNLMLYRGVSPGGELNIQVMYVQLNIQFNIQVIYSSIYPGNEQFNIQVYHLAENQCLMSSDCHRLIWNCTGQPDMLPESDLVAIFGVEQLATHIKQLATHIK